MTVLHSNNPESGLRKACLPFGEVLAQSVANIAPTATPAVNLGLVYASAGNGSWLAYLIATIGLLLVGMNINQFTSRSASPGSLYSSIAKGLGPTAGLLAGWALVLAYVLTAMAVLCGFASYASVVTSVVGITLSPIFWFAVCAAIAWYVAYRDIQLSAIMMLIIEGCSVSLLLIVGFLVFSHHGFHVDVDQLSLKNVTSGNLSLGLVLAVFSYVGFESATALGDEARSPLRTIPKAVLSSTALAGAFFVFMSYVMVMGFIGAPTPLNQTDAPLNFLTAQIGAPFLGFLIAICAMISFFACALASINAGARIFFSMARHGIFHPSLGQAHTSNQTPHIAVSMVSLIAFLVPASISMFGVATLDILGYTGTIATYGFLLVYIMISISASVYLHRIHQLKPLNVVVSVLSVVFMMIPVVGSVYPVPSAPYNVFPYLFLMYLVVGGCWFFMLRMHSPEIIRDMEDEIEANHLRFEEMRKV